MGILLEVYDEMVKEAEKEAAYAVLQERVELLNKYAAVATELLNAEFPNNFEKADVVELADKLIQRDIDINEAQEKTAEINETLTEYVKTARALLEDEKVEFTDSTVEKLASALIDIDLKDNFEKEANVLEEFAFLDEFNKIAETNFESIDELEEALEPIFEKISGRIGATVGGAINPIGAAIGAEKGKRTRSFLGAEAGALAGLGAGVLLMKGRINKGISAVSPDAAKYVENAMGAKGFKEHGKALFNYVTSPGVKEYYKQMAPISAMAAAGSAAGAALAHGKTSGGDK